MNWLNEPRKWSGDAASLAMTADPGTDFWRVTHYGFIRDSGPFHYLEREGDFEASVKVTGRYREQFHQAGLMVRIDGRNWIKAGIEYVDGFQNVSAVVTREVSDWSMAPCPGSPESIRLRLLRKGDYVQVSYSFDGTAFSVLRLAYFPPGVKAQIGLVAAAPGKEPFEALFEKFEVVPAA
jgi:regulation of enolase protein 1 (concanavalin A-like superfamily)